MSTYTAETLRRRANEKSNIEVLNQLQIPYVRRNTSNKMAAFLQIAGRINFWPSTGKWIDKPTARYGKGLPRLFEFMDGLI